MNVLQIPARDLRPGDALPAGRTVAAVSPPGSAWIVVRFQDRRHSSAVYRPDQLITLAGPVVKVPS